MQLKMKKEVQPGSPMPKGYGVSHLVEGNSVKVCYPMPMNHVIAWARSLYFRIRYARPNKWDEKLVLEYTDGLRNGFDKGFRGGQTTIPGVTRQAYRRGFEDGQNYLRGECLKKGTRKGRVQAAQHVSLN